MLAYFVHVGYALMLGAFVARDVLLLRSMLVVAQAIVTGYALSVGVLAIAAWNSLFAAVNLVWAVKIVRDRRRVEVPTELKELYEQHFTALGSRDFLRWWSLGVGNVLKDQQLTWNGRRPDALFFLLDGRVRVSRDAATVTELPAGFFVSEMSLLTGQPANADVHAIGRIEVRQWATSDLDVIRSREPAFWIRIQSAIGLDLVRKVRRGEDPLAGVTT